MNKDNTLFAVAFEDKAPCQELIRIVTGDESLVVIDNKTQYTIRNVENHSVTLDLIVKDSRGKKYAIELQKKDERNAEKRIRYNNSLYDTLLLDKGVDYCELPTVISIFVSKFDVHKTGLPIYHIKMTIEETGQTYDEGRQIIFVNSCNDNGSKIARLMNEFSNKERISSEFTHISERVRSLKEELGGEVIMREKMEALAKEYAEYVVAENDIDYVRKMLKKGYPIAEIAEISPLSLEEIEKMKAKVEKENRTKKSRYLKKSLEKVFARYFRKSKKS
ncbi:MAG: PD-(D/E)XK nuclease family transposase [Lachnospiraceae bacterium]|nr:PD-(D/E)XK nuclease family transposase [Lachnospiraceae bacterium]